MRKPSVTAPGCGRRLALVLASTILLFAGTVAAADAIKIGGTGSALGTLRLLGDEFQKRNPDLQVTVLPSMGSSGAIRALSDGALDIGSSARPLTEAETKLGSIGFEYARSPLVFAVSTKSRVTAITLDELADIYSGKLQKFPDGTPSRPVLRPAGEDIVKQIKRMSPALEAGLAAAEKRPGLPFATTDQETADKIESIPGSLGAVTLSLIKSENRPLRALTLNGAEPTVANAVSGKYPHSKAFYFVTRAEPSAGVKRFLAFMQSPAGREVFARSGNWVP